MMNIDKLSREDYDNLMRELTKFKKKYKISSLGVILNVLNGDPEICQNIATNNGYLTNENNLEMFSKFLEECQKTDEKFKKWFDVFYDFCIGNPEYKELYFIDIGDVVEYVKIILAPSEEDLNKFVEGSELAPTTKVLDKNLENYVAMATKALNIDDNKFESHLKNIFSQKKRDCELSLYS